MQSTLLLSLLTVVMSPALLAQSPVVVMNPIAAPQAKAQYLSSNTVRAVFKGLRVLNPVRLQDLLSPAENPLPGVKVAIFEVIEPLAFQAESSLLSNRMMVGDLFSVDLTGQRHGQSPEATSLAGELQEGEEVVVKLDEYMTEVPREGQLVISSASRMAKRNAVADVQAEDPAAQAVAMPRLNQASAPARAAVSLNPSHLTGNRQMTRISSHNGKTQRIEVRQESIPGTRQMRTRMFINGVEVDPETQQPLKAVAPAAPATPPVNDTANEAEIPSPEPNETF